MQLRGGMRHPLRERFAPAALLLRFRCCCCRGCETPTLDGDDSFARDPVAAAAIAVAAAAGADGGIVAALAAVEERVRGARAIDAGPAAAGGVQAAAAA